jgi:hypothetical protein
MMLSRIHRTSALILIFGFSRYVNAEGLLITCTDAETCDFKAVAALSINGRETVRSIAAKNADSVTLATLRASREKRIDGLRGMVRDLQTGLVYSFSGSDEGRELIFPGGSLPKETRSIAGIWASARIGYRDSLKTKKEQSISTDSFAVYLIGQDLTDVAVTYAKYLVSAPPSAWRGGLLRGVLRFSASAPAYKAWQAQLFASSKDALSKYRKQEGDPRRLSDALNGAIHDCETLVQIAPSESTYSALLAEARGARDSVSRKVIVARALLAAGFWDEYLLKIHELGLVKWSFAELEASERNALIESAKAHVANAGRMAQSGFLERSFDEAQRAYQRNPCSADVVNHFNNIRPQLVERNRDPRQDDASGKGRPELQQVERRLQSLDSTQLQQESNRKSGDDLIAQGDAIDRANTSWQYAKAQFLRKLGKASEAFDVTTDVERHNRLDAKQRDEWLLLDANLSQTLSATPINSLEDAKRNFAAGRFREALDATTPGLTAQPSNPLLLIQRAHAAASLRQSDEALRAIQDLLRSSNAACAGPDTYSQAFSLRDQIDLPPKDLRTLTSEPADGVPNWISGKKYPQGKLYYDPVSLGFVHRISSVTGVKNPQTSTVFTWDGLRLVSIETRSSPPAGGKSGPERTLFFVEPEYAPGTLRMTAIGPRALQEGKRVSYALTFWNDPKVNVGLLQSAGRAAARGWAGNPVFDPFIWTGIFLFDFKYDDKGRVIEANPVPDETRGRSFAETLAFTWEDSTNHLKSVSSKSYRRTLEYDKKGRLVSEESTLPKRKGRTSYQYAGDSVVPHKATSSSVFEQQQRISLFQLGN